MSLEATALKELRLPNTDVYAAGRPNYSDRNFSRDGLIFARLSGNRRAALAQVAFSALHQGKEKNPYTGEEFGKIHHELDPKTGHGVVMDKLDGLETGYSACDTTAEFLAAIAWLAENGHPELLSVYAPNIEAGLTYVDSHVGKDRRFREDPRLANATRFALKVTNWRDSEVNGEDKDPPYPRIDALSHFQNAAAVRGIGRVMKRRELIEKADEMVQAGIDQLWKDDHFITAIDGNGKVIDPPSSDSLHILAYIERGCDALPPGAAKAVEEYMTDLETDFGYRAGIPVNATVDSYHTKNVWPQQQALMDISAAIHQLERPRAVTRRVVPYCNSDGSYYELVDADDGSRKGNWLMLWVIGAISYFKNNRY